ncbi:MAG: tyrosine-type recombinase/integrase [Blastocatellia bacterium]|nr:tyrosine-type recombinase/integrase [Blastocatellia bacterium]
MFAFEFMERGKRYGRRFVYDTKSDAEYACAALRLALRNDREGYITALPTVTLGELREKAEAKKYDKQSLRRFDQFIRLLGDDVELVALSRADWEPFAESIGHLKPTTINRYFTHVLGVLSSASKWFADLEDWKPPRAPWAQEEYDGRRRNFSKSELAAILDGCLAKRQQGERSESVKKRREMMDFMKLILLTAARPGELLKLKPSDINWEDRITKIISIKGGKVKRRTLPLSASAIAILDARKHRPKFFSFSRTEIRRICARISEIAKIPYGDRVEGGWVLYDLRGAAAVALESYSAGVPYSAVMAILGHERTDMTAVYTGAALDKLFEAIEKLEAYVKEIETSYRRNAVSNQNIDGKIMVKPQEKTGQTRAPERQ